MQVPLWVGLPHLQNEVATPTSQAVRFQGAWSHVQCHRHLQMDFWSSASLPPAGCPTYPGSESWTVLFHQVGIPGAPVTVLSLAGAASGGDIVQLPLVGLQLGSALLPHPPHPGLWRDSAARACPACFLGSREPGVVENAWCLHL